MTFLSTPCRLPRKKQGKEILEYFLSTAPAALLMLKQLICPKISHASYPALAALPNPSNNGLTTHYIITTEARYIKRSIVARSRNYCCCGTALSIKYSEYFFLYSCLSYAASKALASYYTVICGLSGSTIFFHII
jgi:hypothetical protein